MAPIKWPPKLARLEVLGEVKDVNGRNTPRDIGRAVHLGGHDYYIFGDTFCFDDKGEFVGATNNTIAYVPDIKNKPTKSQYLEKQPRVSPYIPFTPSEEAYENDPEHKKNNDRVTCWSFGDIIPDQPGASEGWAYFGKALTHQSTAGKFFGVGLCRVKVKHGHHIEAERVMGDDMIFGEDEPHFGNLANFCGEDGYVYLLGGKDVKPPFDLRCLVCRIKRGTDFTKRDNYEFWVKDGEENGKWARTYSHLDDLKRLSNMDIQGQGSLHYLPGFAPQGKPYMWFGVNKYMAGHLYVGCAPAVTGPWEIEDGCELPHDPPGSQGPRYALYACPWASNVDAGEMLCTWSDAGQMGGKVVAARCWFEREGDESSGQGPHITTSPTATSLKDKLTSFFR